MATITFRSDSDVERALARLMENGRTKTDAIKGALLLAADLQYREQLRIEASELAHDGQDLAEIKAITEDMDAISAW